MNKQSLRNIYKQQLINLSESEKHDQTTLINTTLTTWLSEHNPKKIGAFYPQKSEPNIWPVIENYAKTNTVYLPKFDPTKQHYGWAPVKDPLTNGKFNIKEPLPPIDPQVQLNACLVPALAIDHHLNRLGWGFGYFDRLLTHQITHRIGIIFTCQLHPSSQLPTDQWDIPLTKIIHGHSKQTSHDQ